MSGSTNDSKSRNNKKNSRRKGTHLTYQNVENFIHPKNIPNDIEEEVLTCYVDFNVDQDMKIDDLGVFFTKLSLPESIYKFVIYKDPQELCVSGTDVIDFDKLLIETYHLLIYMDNVDTIDEYWSLLVESCQRDVQFPQVKLKDHVLGLKQLKTILSNVSGGNDTKDCDSLLPLISMMKVASSLSSKKLFINYLDFAMLLGKIGLLNYI